MITFSLIEKTGAASWHFEWTATTAPYRIYLDGRLVSTVTSAEYDYEGRAYGTYPPPLEVLDANDSTTAQNLDYSPRLTLQWRGVTGTAYYVVEYYADAAWTRVDLQIPETGFGYYNYQTPVLTDVTTAQWRVLAVDAYANESDPLAFSALIVRNPDTPDVTMTYSAVSGNVTIAEAS
jgi:hypothetical protein